MQRVCACTALTIKKAFGSQVKIPSPKAILHGFLPVTEKLLNSYVFISILKENDQWL